jgi:hypothetical protein
MRDRSVEFCLIELKPMHAKETALSSRIGLLRGSCELGPLGTNLGPHDLRGEAQYLRS